MYLSLIIKIRLALNSWSFYFRLLSARITAVCHLPGSISVSKLYSMKQHLLAWGATVLDNSGRCWNLTTCHSRAHMMQTWKLKGISCILHPMILWLEMCVEPRAGNSYLICLFFQDDKLEGSNHPRGLKGWATARTLQWPHSALF